MENKFKEFWIEFDKLNCREFVYTEPVDGLDKDAIYVVEYAALQACEARLESASAENERLVKELIKIAIEHPCYKLSKELESENKKLKDEIWNKVFRPRHKHGYNNIMLNEFLETDSGHLIMDELEKLYREVINEEN